MRQTPQNHARIQQQVDIAFRIYKKLIRKRFAQRGQDAIADSAFWKLDYDTRDASVRLYNIITRSVDNGCIGIEITRTDTDGKTLEEKFINLGTMERDHRLLPERYCSLRPLDSAHSDELIYLDRYSSITIVQDRRLQGTPQDPAYQNISSCDQKPF